MSGCSYLLVTDRKSLTPFRVTLNNDASVTVNTTVKRTLTIEADGQTVYLGQKQGDSFIATVGSKVVSLPYQGVPQITKVCVSKAVFEMLRKNYCNE